MLNTTDHIEECDYQCFCSTNCTSKDNATIVNTVDCQPKEQNPVFQNLAIGCWVVFGVALLGMIVIIINDWAIWQKITNSYKESDESDGAGLCAAIGRYKKSAISCIENMLKRFLSIFGQELKMNIAVFISLWTCLFSELVDIVFDILLLYQVVGEELLDTPDYVIWLMFVFILTGIAKLVWIYYIVKTGSEDDDEDDLNETTAWIKIFNVCIAFVLEDFVEVGAQYFFIDKYQTSLSWTVILNGAYMVAMSIWAMYKIVKSQIGAHSCKCSSMVSLSLVCICPIWILSLHVCRLGGAIYQMASGEVRNGCLQYIDDRLVKTPFAFEEECFREIDWFILVSLCFLTIPALVVTIGAVGLLLKTKAANRRRIGNASASKPQ